MNHNTKYATNVNNNAENNMFDFKVNRKLKLHHKCLCFGSKSSV